MDMSAAEKLLPGIDVIDAHAHVGKWALDGIEGSVYELRKLLDLAGISKVIVSSVLALTYDAREGNAEVEKFVESDERVYGAVVFNANYMDEARDEINRYADNPRFVCAKNHPSYARMPINAAPNLKMIELLAEKKLPLTFHTWTGDGPKASDVAKRFPELTMFWFHALAADYRLAAELAKDLPNVYLEYVTSVQERGKIEYLVSALGADRVIFGTDESLQNPVYHLAPLYEACISDDDRRKILSLNALRLFDFGKA
jgi:predicted TIM-barrel fold metal-dependent hydrolase